MHLPRSSFASSSVMSGRYQRSKMDSAKYDPYPCTPNRTLENERKQEKDIQCVE